MMVLKDAGQETDLDYRTSMITTRTKEGIIKMDSINESQLLTNGAWDLAHASECRAMKREYEDWMAEQNRLSDDRYGIVCARDEDRE
jgi:hypothetical protein